MNPLLNFSRFLQVQRGAMNLFNSFRFASCANDKSRCPKGKIRTSACKDNKHEIPPRKPPKKDVFKSMWEEPKCDRSVAKCPATRFDTLYYKPSNKAKRIYQQTWVECPKRKIKPKVVCEFPKDSYPPLERRQRKAKPDTARCRVHPDLISCDKSKGLKQNTRCLKITLPGCRGVRASIKCRVIRKPSDCKPPKTPYPSFSECTKPKVKPKRPNECECLKIRSMCEVWTILRRKAVL